MKNKKVLDGLGFAGLILNIVVTGLESFLALVFVYVGFEEIMDEVLVGIFFFIVAILTMTISLITLVFNAKVLSGELRHKRAASILGFICLSIAGSVLLVISTDDSIEVQDKSQNNKAHQLMKFKELLDLGTITEEEFKTLKGDLIKA